MITIRTGIIITNKVILASKITGLNKRYKPKQYDTHCNYALFYCKVYKKTCIFKKKNKQVLFIHNTFK